MMDRRSFIALTGAFAVAPKTPKTPKTPEAAGARVDVLDTATGQWRTEPNGLLAVRRGQRFRISDPVDGALRVEATACEDGHWGTDCAGKWCGCLAYDIATAVGPEMEAFK